MRQKSGEALEQAYQTAIAKLEPGIKQTFLLHSATDSTLWRIVTVWRSREALDEMRQSGQTPRGVLMFRAAARPLFADRGYDSDGHRRALWDRSIQPWIVRRYVEHGSGVGAIGGWWKELCRGCISFGDYIFVLNGVLAFIRLS